MCDVVMVTHELNTAGVFFCRYGKIVSTKAILDKTTNKCKGELLKNEQRQNVRSRKSEKVS